MAKIRLTKDIRIAICASVIDATTLRERADDLHKRARALLADTIKKGQPEKFYTLTLGLPKDWFSSQDQISLGQCDPVRVLHDANLADVRYLHLHDPLPVAYDVRTSVSDDESIFGPLRDEAEKLVEERQQRWNEVMGFLQSVSTIDAMLERMPELERHVPRKASLENLPVVPASNLLASLQKSGYVAKG